MAPQIGNFALGPIDIYNPTPQLWTRQKHQPSLIVGQMFGPGKLNGGTLARQRMGSRAVSFMGENGLWDRK